MKTAWNQWSVAPPTHCRITRSLCFVVMYMCHIFTVALKICRVWHWMMGRTQTPLCPRAQSLKRWRPSFTLWTWQARSDWSARGPPGTEPRRASPSTVGWSVAWMCVCVCWRGGVSLCECVCMEMGGGGGQYVYVSVCGGVNVCVCVCVFVSDCVKTFFKLMWH